MSKQIDAVELDMLGADGTGICLVVLQATLREGAQVILGPVSLLPRVWSQLSPKLVDMIFVCLQLALGSDEPHVRACHDASQHRALHSLWGRG